MPRYQAEVDPTLCTGAQMCVSVAPDGYRYDPAEGVSRAVGQPTDDPAILEAAELCPVEAIRVRDADTGAQLFP